MNARIKLFIPLIVFLVLSLFLFRGLYLDPSHLPSALVGKPLPEFSLPQLEDEDGAPLTRSAIIGEPFLLNIWATWCPSCIHEHPFLLQLAAQGVRILGVNYKDDSVAARQWLVRYQSPYQLNIVDADGYLGLDLGVYGAPETFVVNSEGLIVYKHVGVLDEQVWKAHIAPLMN